MGGGLHSLREGGLVLVDVGAGEAASSADC